MGSSGKATTSSCASAISPVGLTQIEARQRNVEAILRSSGMELAAIKKARQARLDTLSIPELASADRFDLEAFCRVQAQSAYLGDHTALCRILGRYKMYIEREIQASAPTYCSTASGRCG